MWFKLLLLFRACSSGIWIISFVFLELGFKDSEVWQPVNFAEFERILGVNWYSCERMQIDLGVEITSEMRRAFLRMGIQSECSAIK